MPQCCSKVVSSREQATCAESGYSENEMNSSWSHTTSAAQHNRLHKHARADGKEQQQHGQQGRDGMCAAGQRNGLGAGIGCWAGARRPAQGGVCVLPAQTCSERRPRGECR